MRTQKYKSRGGAEQYMPVLTDDEMAGYMTDSSGEGFCLACGEMSPDSVEPDARRYRCDSCDAHKVYGIPELVIMGLYKIAE
jgi:hypothetical protein